MGIWRFATAVCALALGFSAASASAQQAPPPLRIGVITDMSGVFSDISGPGAVLAIKMAAEDYGGSVLGRPIEVLAADHQNKADIAVNLAREWIDTQNVAMLGDLMNSSAAIAIVALANEKKRVAIVNGASSSSITDEHCTPYSLHYTWDTYALAHGTASQIVKQGGDSWFFITVDYAFGHQLEHDASEVVTALGAKVLGAVRHPLNSSDLSSFLLQAQNSGAKVIALANAGSDLVNAIKGASEFGIATSGRQKLVSLGIGLNEARAIGLQAAQGLYLTEAWYWDYDDETRAFAKRFFARFGKMPTSTQAGDYSSTLHYLKAVAAAGTDDADAVMRKMREMPVNDFFAKNGHIREDGLMVHDLYLAQVKSPAESKDSWDLYKILAVIPGEEAFLPLAKSVCPMVRH
ncbi:MAG: ABC transporter substrate-binding protein [Alphaproteobacteria bacterium]|nr:ABC transporter substrate-binding protein [Alphaproteobacteria bacterium]